MTREADIEVRSSCLEVTIEPTSLRAYNFRRWLELQRVA